MASAGRITALYGSSHPSKVPSKSTHPCTKSSTVTKNVFDAFQSLSKEIGGSSTQQLDAADGLLEPVTDGLQLLLVELL